MRSPVKPFEKLENTKNSDMDIAMYVGPNFALVEKSQFRSDLLSCIQRDVNTNSLLVKFLMSKKDEILALMEMLKR